MSKKVKAIRNKKQAVAIRTGIVIGRKLANEYGEASTNDQFVNAIYGTTAYAPSEGDIFYSVMKAAKKSYAVQLKKNKDTLWTEKEYSDRYYKVELANMGREERQDYLLRKEVAELRKEVAEIKNFSN